MENEEKKILALKVYKICQFYFLQVLFKKYHLFANKNTSNINTDFYAIEKKEDRFTIKEK